MLGSLIFTHLQQPDGLPAPAPRGLGSGEVEPTVQRLDGRAARGRIEPQGG